MDYFVLRPDRDRRWCRIDDDDNFDEDEPGLINATEGLPVGHLPKPLEFEMSTGAPGILVPDWIDNTLELSLASGRMVDFLKSRSRARIEFLPFTLRNHKGRVACDAAAVVNLLDTVDAVDAARTQGELDPVNEGWYLAIRYLALDPESLDPALDLFRLASHPMTFIVREDLRDEMERAGLTGLTFLELETEVDLR